MQVMQEHLLARPSCNIRVNWQIDNIDTFQGIKNGSPWTAILTKLNPGV
jgi:hypothetical protein